MEDSATPGNPPEKSTMKYNFNVTIEKDGAMARRNSEHHWITLISLSASDQIKLKMGKTHLDSRVIHLSMCWRPVTAVAASRPSRCPPSACPSRLSEVLAASAFSAAARSWSGKCPSGSRPSWGAAQLWEHRLRKEKKNVLKMRHLGVGKAVA